MELRQLRYFLSAAKHLSFTRAAEECCIVQSAMSQQIRSLEKELDVVLFDRTKQGLRLTPEGRIAAQEAQRLLRQAEAMQEAIRQARSSARSLLRVGCQGNLLRESLPRALASMKARYPDTRVYIQSGPLQKILGELRDDQLDCAVTLYGKRLEELDWIGQQAIALETARVMLPAQSPLAAQDRVSIKALAGQTLIHCPAFEETPGDPIDLGGKRVRVESRSDLEAMVAAGYGVSFCPGSAVQPHPGIACREVEGLPCGQICLVWRRGSPAEERVHAFASLLMMTASEKNAVF